MIRTRLVTLPAGKAILLVRDGDDVVLLTDADNLQVLTLQQRFVMYDRLFQDLETHPQAGQTLATVLQLHPVPQREAI